MSGRVQEKAVGPGGASIAIPCVIREAMKNGLLPLAAGQRELEDYAATLVGTAIGFADSATGEGCAVKIACGINGQTVGIHAVGIGLALKERMKDGLRPLAVRAWAQLVDNSSAAGTTATIRRDAVKISGVVHHQWRVRSSTVRRVVGRVRIATRWFPSTGHS